MFQDRHHAGRLLAAKLQHYKQKEDLFVVGITRGGVVVAKEVADSLSLPLRAIVIKKIGAPQNAELAIGAVGPLHTVYWDDDLCQQLQITNGEKQQEKDKKIQEQKKLQKEINLTKSLLDIKEKNVILIDDGIATGATAIAAALVLQKLGVAQRILAVPVISEDTLSKLKKYFLSVILLTAPKTFYAVAQFYQKFGQVTEEEVKRIL